jgi:toxin-antitoxin system PIN domain toxin
VSQHLLDVNVLVAMAWPRHTSHAAVQKWLGRHADDGWASCPLTQAGFARIVSNPAFSRDALTPKQAVAVLQANLEHPAHHFWPDSLALHEALAGVGELAGHNQITDAYLLALAISRKGTLVTLDKSIARLANRIPGRPLIVIS